MRKNIGLEVTDRITIFVSRESTFESVLDKFEDYIKTETLGDSIEFDENLEDEYDLNGHSVKIKINKA